MTIKEVETLLSSPSEERSRTVPEQALGLGIYLCLSLGLTLFSKLSFNLWGVAYSVCLSLAIWVIWRQISLRLLKVELAAFLSQFVFQTSWSLCHFQFNQPLLALASLLLLWSNTLLVTLLFWKKDRLSGVLYLYPLVWVFGLAAINMFTDYG